ncbi:MAG: 50S ribosomal protein L21 [Candidatus Krumholzibacteria bacterium]|nr:50S ribosomal protein L21 [Candidatus Krumholzibacteria bacterium]
MYAVVRLAGRQLIVKPNEIVDVPLLDLEPGTVINCDEVLAYSDGKDVRVGKPLVEGVKVLGEVMGHGREDKILLYKMRRRKGYRRKQGHRQHYTRVRIKEITA